MNNQSANSHQSTVISQRSTVNSPLRVMVFRMNGVMHLQILRNLINRGSIDVMYWGGSKEGFRQAQDDKEHFSRTIFHDSFDAVQGLPPRELEEEKFEPPGTYLVNKFNRTESQILTMMNSVEPIPVPLLKKKHIYFKYLKYWYGVLKKYKPDAIFFGDVPHLTYQHLLYRVAKELAIPTIMHRAIQVRGRIMFMDNVEEYRTLREKYKEYSHSSFSVEDLSGDIKKYYLEQTSAPKDSKVFYMKDDYIKRLSKNAYAAPSVYKVFIHLKNLTFWQTAKTYLKILFRKKPIVGLRPLFVRGLAMRRYVQRWSSIRRGFEKEYRSLVKHVDFSEKFVYVPLQNQPEGNTSAMGDVFVDQILMIDIVASALPAGWKLYVKESPLQWSAFRAYAGRYGDYYKDIASLRNVTFVSPDTPTLELIDKSQAVATVTGTAGWEAVLRGKPALLFGYIWYMCCDGVFQVGSKKDVEEALMKIKNGYKPDRQKVLNFLKAVDEVSVRAFQNTRFQKGNKLAISMEENIQNITNGFIHELSKLRV